MKRNEHITDGELIRRYRAGERQVLKLLVTRYHQVFCQRAFYVVKDRTSAKDIAQDCWIVIIAKLPDLKRPDQFKFWALRIVYTKSVDYLKKRNINLHNHLDLESRTTASDTSESLREKQQKALLSAIHSLPQSKQHLLQLYYLERYSVREISQLLNIPTGTVKSRLFKTREKLKETIKIDKS